ncbi:MAG: methionine synthase [Armatimonadota bacterium]|nr:methionine synthase [Armatimonadota bacterium]
MRSNRAAQFRQALRQRVLVFDGAMGTSIQARNLPLTDFEGLEGCNEILVFTRPDVIREIHASFLEVGCEAVETNSFGANRVVLGEYGIADRAYELNRRAAELAREVADAFSTADRPRFVVGSIGPGTRLPTLGHTTFDFLRATYREQAAGLVEGGADVLLVETCQDLLQAKAAVVGIVDYLRETGRDVPLMVQVTIESTGTMLLGTEIGAALTALAGYPLDAFGLNCGVGPDRMAEHLRYLAQNSPLPISCLPNAGLPENVGGRTVYPLSAEDLAVWLQRFVEEDGARIVGGCCGTTPAHLAAVVEALRTVTPRVFVPARLEPACASLYTSVPFRQQPPPLLVGERTNVIGSRRFKQLLEAEDWDGMVTLARDQARLGGAHAVDVCVAYVGRDETRDMREVITRFVRQVSVPLVVDSTEPRVIEEALKHIGGKAVINSINLEEGEERACRVLALAKEHNAAVIAMTIDEEGMARQAEKKAAIAERIYRLATERYGIPGHDLLFDAITFTLATGDEESRRAAVETMKGIRLIKERLPDVHCILGISNVSFGLNPAARHVLNSVFLHYAIQHGLDAAIVDAARILPLYRIPEEQREAARQLLFDERRPGFDPLTAYMSLFSSQSAAAQPAAAAPPQSLEERLKARIVDGDRPGLEALLDEALTRYPPLRIINEILLEGMRVVGELFGSGQMQLPFVLQSAEVMKAAVAYLEPHMEKSEETGRGTIVLATVKGDVHDIGKNLVDIILSNNGYRVVNLGIKQPISAILDAARQHHADAIGMSGLLVKSTVVMKENLEEMNREGVSLPVLLGGAALTRRYVEEDLRALYRGEVFYGQDAFEGLRVMNQLCGIEAAAPPATESRKARAPRTEVRRVGDLTPPSTAADENQGQAPSRPTATPPSSSRPPVPAAPFFGSRVVTDIPLNEVFTLVNETTLFRAQWQFRRRRSASLEEYQRLIEETVRPLYEALKRQCIEEELLQPRVVYGYFPCNAEGNDLIVWDEEGRRERLRFTFPRQSGRQGLSLADYWRPRDEGLDLLPCMIVTIGERATQRARTLFAADRYRDYLYLHGLSVETAEALAEYWHREIRRELGIAGSDHPDPQKLIKMNYQGCRYSFGYPACPRLEDQEKLFALLQPERIGVRLTEEYQLEPEQSTSAIISYHPEAHYFSLD